ncbi:MAG: hypothetical protein M9958_00420 [Chitinophagales bacterium]|nr:hypothetical protein [Chitinophagales bacterium]
MTFEEFNKVLQEAARESSSFLDRSAAPEIEAAALRFVDDNFRNQAWEGVRWEKSGEGNTILVASGALKRGFTSERTPGQVKVINDMPYAKVHNEGFNETVQVKAHTRGQYSGKKSKRKITATHKVKAHSRKMNIKKRQFAPYQGNESDTLNHTVKIIIDHNIKKIFS